MRHALRIFLITLALILIGLALTPRATPAQGVAPCTPDRPIPYWWHLRPEQPCGGDQVTLVFGSCQDCVELLGYAWPDSGALRLDLRVRDVCPMTLVCRPDTLEIPLGVFAAGSHRLNYDVRAGVVYGDSGFCYVTRRDSILFRVGCPEPPPGPLPFVSTVRIGPPPTCPTCPPRICPGEPIPFLVAGTLPSSCYQFRELQLLPSPIMGPRQEPPIVRIVVAQNDCMDWPCLQVATPWAAEARLPGLMPGSYGLMMQLAVVSMCDSNKVDTTYYATQPFAVRDSCLGPPPPPTESCFMTGWDPFGGSGGCAAFVGPGRPARVAMTLATEVPLAGLQGKLSFYPPGLRIARLVPMGQAEGMHITWEPRSDGADFLMFAEQGAPLVPVRCDSNERCRPPAVLGVVLEPVEGAPPPPVTHLTVHSLLGSDSLGNAVPECRIMTLVVVEARICAGPSCDFNQDGSLDVRDLVAMVHCVLGNGACPDTLLVHLDCDGDGRTNVDDVLCCARSILRGGGRDTMPGRAEPNVTVQIGEPAWEASGLKVPIRLLDADRIGAARLALALPLDRYQVAGVETGGEAGQWLELHDVVDGRLVLGLIGLSPAVPAHEPQTLDLTLHLTLRPGQNAGGDLGLADLQASGPDGITLEIPVAPGTVALPSPDALALSAARPNPFAQETRFALNLDRGAEVDLAIHDLGGRRVATLFQGALGAGPHEFAWSGVRSDGSTAANGIYFVRARVGGARYSRKVVYLRGN